MLSKYLNSLYISVFAVNPNTLFVQWNIDEKVKVRLLKKYKIESLGSSIPVLKVTNITKDFSFDIVISDFTDNWYINNIDSNCEYIVELGRFYRDVFYSFISSNKVHSGNDKQIYSDFVNMYNLKNNTETIVRVPKLLKDYSYHLNYTFSSENPSSDESIRS